MSGKQYTNKTISSIEIVIIKKNQIEIMELKNPMSKVENTIESFNRRLDQAKKRVSKLRDRSFYKLSNQKNNNIRKSEERKQGLRDTIEKMNICIMKATEG